MAMTPCAAERLACIPVDPQHVESREQLMQKYERLQQETLKSRG